MEKIYGLKWLTKDGNSPYAIENGGTVVHYPENEWVDVLGNGSYVAISAGFERGGYRSDILAFFECENKKMEPSEGIQCFFRVKRLVDIPNKAPPEALFYFTRYAIRLSAEKRMDLARKMSLDERGEIAFYATNLPSDQRVALAKEATPEWRETISRYATGLSDAQRSELRNG